jgi:hypothetical protein
MKNYKGIIRGTTDAEFIEAVKNSKSVAEVLKKLNLIAAGGNYASFYNKVSKLKLDTSHFTGMLWNKGRTFEKKPIEFYLKNNPESSITSDSLKKRLIKEGFLERKCYSCSITEWRGRPVPIELEHIDGNRKNNSLDNLTILCPNCHAQTPTFRRKK